MNRQLVLVALVLAFGSMGSLAMAQCPCAAAFAPAPTGYTAYYAPTVTYAPPLAYVSYYAPAVQPCSSCYAPAVQPYVSYYAPTVAPYVVRYGAIGPSIYGTAKFYVPGEPVRNTWRAVTP